MILPDLICFHGVKGDEEHDESPMIKFALRVYWLWRKNVGWSRFDVPAIVRRQKSGWHWLVVGSQIWPLEHCTPAHGATSHFPSIQFVPARHEMQPQDGMHVRWR
jgi:hypothetical protein